MSCPVHARVAGPRHRRGLAAALILLLAAPAASAFTADYTFDRTDEDFEKENDQAESDVGWDNVNDRVRVVSDRRDGGDEIYKRGIPDALTAATGFRLTAKWRATQQGNWQGAFPVFLAADGVMDVKGAANSVYVQYSSRDENLHQAPEYLLRYRDAGGVLRVDRSFIGATNTEYHLYVDYAAASRVLTLKIRDADDADLATATYTVGSNPNDGFTLEKVGVASDGTGEMIENEARGWTDTIVLTVPDPAAAPRAPRDVVATTGPGVGQIRLTWEAPPAPDDFYVTGYRLLRGDAAGQGTFLTSVEEDVFDFTDNGIPEGATRFYRVQAVNDRGAGAASSEVSARAPARPSAPQDLAAQPGPLSAEITLSWKAPADAGGVPLDAYRIYRGPAPGQEAFYKEVAGNVLTFADVPLVPGERFSYRVAAKNLVAEGPRAASAAATVPLAPPLLDADADFFPDEAERQLCGRPLVAQTINQASPTSGRCLNERDYAGPEVSLADADGDQLPDDAERQVCGRAAVAQAVNLIAPTAGRCATPSDYEPPVSLNADPDHDAVPDLLEPTLCRLEDRNTPAEGVCAGENYDPPL